MPQLFEGPGKTDAPRFRFRSRLDSRFYWFRFRYVTRTDSWWLSLDANDGSPLIETLAIRVGQSMFEAFDDARLPEGVIRFDDTDGQSRDPGRLDLGRRVRMIYVPAAELVVDEPPPTVRAPPPPPAPPGPSPDEPGI